MSEQSASPDESQPQSPPKRVLYYAPTDLQFRRWFADIKRIEGCDVVDTRYPPRVAFDGLEIIWSQESTPEGAMDDLSTMYAHLVLLDLRHAPEPDDMAAGITQARQLLTLLDQVDDLESRYGFHRIVALVSGPDPVAVDRLMVELGGVGIKHVLRQRTSQDDATPTEHEAVSFAASVLEYLVALFREPRPHRRAMCLAGGGITGIYYEQGALKCLDDCLAPLCGSLPCLNAFDMYFGISAGAINSGILSMGYAIEEFMASIAGIEGGRLAPIDLNLIQLQNLNLRTGLRRMGVAVQESWGALRRALRGSVAPPEDALALGTDFLGAPFHADYFEGILRGIFTAPGATNDFRKLPRELYIGATDQDLKRHVLFGEPGLDHIPISKAIQASLSIHPAFSSVEINGRYYEDGAVTKTSNFSEAIQRGAGLAFVFDPFLPYVSREVGFTHRRGLLYNIDQDIRTLSFTRYENTRNWVLRKHPDVALYTFVPSNRLRHLISRNPMDHKPYMEIWKGAYISTLRRIHATQHRLRGDLAAFGLKLDTDPADAIKARLTATETPSFGDFFADGQVKLRKPPLALKQLRAQNPV